MTILGLQLGLSSENGQHAQLQVDDVIMIVHNALGSDGQRLGPQGLQVTALDLSLAAAKLTIFGPGEIAVDDAVTPNNGCMELDSTALVTMLTGTCLGCSVTGVSLELQLVVKHICIVAIGVFSRLHCGVATTDQHILHM